jgi:hypothetical protein
MHQDPWDLTLGANWFPFERREMHINMQGIYDHHSPSAACLIPIWSAGRDGFSTLNSSSPLDLRGFKFVLVNTRPGFQGDPQMTKNPREGLWSN